MENAAHVARNDVAGLEVWAAGPGDGIWGADVVTWVLEDGGLGWEVLQVKGGRARSLALCPWQEGGPCAPGQRWAAIASLGYYVASTHPARIIEGKCVVLEVGAGIADEDLGDVLVGVAEARRAAEVRGDVQAVEYAGWLYGVLTRRAPGFVIVAWRGGRVVCRAR